MLKKSNLKEIGIYDYGFISTNDIPFEEEIRKICQDNACRMYGKTWACPPAVGTVEECRLRCVYYKKGMVFNAVYDLEDSFDYEGMMYGHSKFKELSDRLYELTKPQMQEFSLLSNEGCKRCKKCTYPYKPCR